MTKWAYSCCAPGHQEFMYANNYEQQKDIRKHYFARKKRMGSYYSNTLIERSESP